MRLCIYLGLVSFFWICNNNSFKSFLFSSRYCFILLVLFIFFILFTLFIFSLYFLIKFFYFFICRDRFVCLFSIIIDLSNFGRRIIIGHIILEVERLSQSKYCFIIFRFFIQHSFTLIDRSVVIFLIKFAECNVQSALDFHLRPRITCFKLIICSYNIKDLVVFFCSFIVIVLFKIFGCFIFYFLCSL